MKRPALLALGVPAALVLAPISIAGDTTFHGLPVSVMWMFCCIPLVTVCMLLAERFRR